jgi:hypothetical protein
VLPLPLMALWLQHCAESVQPVVPVEKQHVPALQVAPSRELQHCVSAEQPLAPSSKQHLPPTSLKTWQVPAQQAASSGHGTIPRGPAGGRQHLPALQGTGSRSKVQHSPLAEQPLVPGSKQHPVPPPKSLKTWQVPAQQIVSSEHPATEGASPGGRQHLPALQGTPSPSRGQHSLVAEQPLVPGSKQHPVPPPKSPLKSWQVPAQQAVSSEHPATAGRLAGERQHLPALQGIPSPWRGQHSTLAEQPLVPSSKQHPVPPPKSPLKSWQVPAQQAESSEHPATAGRLAGERQHLPALQGTPSPSRGQHSMSAEQPLAPNSMQHWVDAQFVSAPAGTPPSAVQVSGSVSKQDPSARQHA